MNPIRSTAAAAATLTILAMLAACGGGGGSSPTTSGMPGDPPTMTPDPGPAVPTVASNVTVTERCRDRPDAGVPGAAGTATGGRRFRGDRDGAGLAGDRVRPARRAAGGPGAGRPRSDDAARSAPVDAAADGRRDVAGEAARRTPAGRTVPLAPTTACAGTAGDSSYHPDADVALPDGFLDQRAAWKSPANT